MSSDGVAVEDRSASPYTHGSMNSKEIVNLVSQLTPEEQAAVREFIEFIRGRKSKPEGTPFLKAVDEFAAAHPELLRRLAE